MKAELAKKIGVWLLIALNIFIAGAVVGAWKWDQYKSHQAAKQDQVVQAAIKSVQVAEAKN